MKSLIVVIDTSVLVVAAMSKNSSFALDLLDLANKLPRSKLRGIPNGKAHFVRQACYEKGAKQASGYLPSSIIKD
jgi:hypothetical protein